MIWKKMIEYGNNCKVRNTIQIKCSYYIKEQSE